MKTIKRADLAFWFRDEITTEVMDLLQTKKAETVERLMAPDNEFGDYKFLSGYIAALTYMLEIDRYLAFKEEN